MLEFDILAYGNLIVHINVDKSNNLKKYTQWITCWWQFDHHPTNPHCFERWEERCVIHTRGKDQDNTDPYLYSIQFEHGDFPESHIRMGSLYSQMLYYQ